MTLAGLNWLKIRPGFHKTRKINRAVIRDSSDAITISISLVLHLVRPSSLNTDAMSTQAGYPGGQQAAKQGRARARVVPDEVVRERQSHACELNDE